jgi:hypothetical protein
MSFDYFGYFRKALVDAIRQLPDPNGAADTTLVVTAMFDVAQSLAAAAKVDVIPALIAGVVTTEPDEEKVISILRQAYAAMRKSEDSKH